MQGTAQYISSFFHKASFGQPVKSACSAWVAPIAGLMLLDIQRASVMVTDMPQSKALLDVFRDQQAYKIRVDLEADLSWIQPVGGKQAFIELSASAADTVEESASPNSFDIAIREVMQQAITQLDKEVRLKIAEIPEMTRP